MKTFAVIFMKCSECKKYDWIAISPPPKQDKKIECRFCEADNENWILKEKIKARTGMEAERLYDHWVRKDDYGTPGSSTDCFDCWVDPEGRVYPCGFGGHEVLDCEIAQQRGAKGFVEGTYLKSQGWVAVNSCNYLPLYVYDRAEKVTQAQLNRLYEHAKLYNITKSFNKEFGHLKETE